MSVRWSYLPSQALYKYWSCRICLNTTTWKVDYWNTREDQPGRVSKWRSSFEYLLNEWFPLSIGPEDQILTMFCRTFLVCGGETLLSPALLWSETMLSTMWALSSLLVIASFGSAGKHLDDLFPITCTSHRKRRTGRALKVIFVSLPFFANINWNQFCHFGNINTPHINLG